MPVATGNPLRRRHKVEMTPAGERAVAQAEEKLESVEDEVLGKLTASERATLHGLLVKALETTPDA
jgi:DNA-binding MarR family transcriptional regulator